MIILIAIGIYYGRGYLLVIKAEKAYYDSANCKEVMDTVTKIKQQYPVVIAPYAEQTSPWAEVCQLFLSAEEMHQAGQYEEASKVYMMVKDRFNKNMETKLIEKQTRLYLDWAASAKKNGNTLQAESILTNLWNITEISPQQAFSVGLTENELTKALSRSTGEYTRKLINEALSEACNGQPSHSAALTISEIHRAGVFGIPDKLSEDLRAVTPGDLHYAVCVRMREEKEPETSGCHYGSGSGVTIVRTIIIWNVEVREIPTGQEVYSTTIKGIPPECASDITFRKSSPNSLYIQDKQDWSKGQPPDFVHLNTWLMGKFRAVIQLRNTPIIVSRKEADKEFGLDSDFLPQEFTYIDNKFEIQDKIIIDHKTGLMWQQSGSGKMLTYSNAQSYIKKLNTQQFAGYDDWRLPTIPELMSLSEPKKQSNGLCIAPIFDVPHDPQDELKRFPYWSGDKMDESGNEVIKGGVWVVFYITGSVDSMNPSRQSDAPMWYSAYVRGVRP